MNIRRTKYQLEKYKEFIDNGQEFSVRTYGDAKNIIEAMKKQIPEKPKKSGVTDRNGVFHPTCGIDGVPHDLCPTCGYNLYTAGFLAKNKMNYCENCGQALCWEEVE